MRLLYFQTIFEIEFEILHTFGFIHQSESAFLTAGRLLQDKERRAIPVFFGNIEFRGTARIPDIPETVGASSRPDVEANHLRCRLLRAHLDPQTVLLCLLGESAAESEITLNSIIESFSPAKLEDPKHENDWRKLYRR